jgi:hypothetical protein
MNNYSERQGNRLHYWGLNFLIAVLLIIVGYKSPTIWLSISATIWVGYLIVILTSPLLIAASQNTCFARIAKRMSSVLGTIAVAALISTPVVMFHWYRVTYFGNH